MSQDRNPTAGLLIIGNELLSGQVQDENGPYIAQRLHDLGIDLKEIRLVPDQEDPIIQAVLALSQQYDSVFTTGGIGPTHDDITTQAMAKAFGRPLEYNAEAQALLFKASSTPDSHDLQSNLRMAKMPTRVSLVENPINAVPGFQIKNVFVLAGIPQIARAMFETLIPRLKIGTPRHSIKIFGRVVESQIADPLSTLQEAFSDIEIGSYPHWRTGHEQGVTLVLKGVKSHRVQQAAHKVFHLLETLHAQPIILPEGGGLFTSD